MVTEESITETLPTYIASELATPGYWRKIEKGEPGERKTSSTTIIQDRDRTQLNSGDLPMLLFRGARRTNHYQTFSSSHVQSSAMCKNNNSVKHLHKISEMKPESLGHYTTRSLPGKHIGNAGKHRHFLMMSWRFFSRREIPIGLYM